MNKRRFGGILLAAGVVCGTTWIGAPGASAASGSLLTYFGSVAYYDSTDTYRVCDTATDHVGVSGRISVRQADGSWKEFPWVRDGSGDDGRCFGNTVDIDRETSDILLEVCRQNGDHGTRYSCQSDILSGT